jgi:hypothetical protein
METKAPVEHNQGPHLLAPDITALRDLTSQESRSQAARQGAVGHLAGEQLRNSVMNVQ